jgi:flavin-dependent dehydrogenase
LCHWCDAASAANPATGQGIDAAMVLGLMAARFIAQAVQNQNFTEASFTKYDKEMQRRLLPEVKYFNKLWDRIDVRISRI